MRGIGRPALALGLLAATAFAQPSALSLTLDDCIRLAQAVQSAVGIARQQVEIARYGAVQARANFLPQFSIGSGFNYNSPVNGTFSYVALNGIREYVSLGTLAAEIDTSGRLRAVMARARADQDAAAANLALSQRDLRRVIAAAYYRVLLARRLIAVTRDSLAESQAFERRTRLLAQNGEAAQADVVKASAEVAFLQQSLNANELEARIANHDLASFWTTDVDTPLILTDVLEGPAPEPEAAPTSSPYLGRIEFRLFDAQHRGFLADARRARADLYPQLSFVGQYGIDALRVSWPDRGYAAFIRLNIPVFDWFRARSASRQSQIQANQVEMTRQITERLFSRDYRDALARVAAIHSQIGIAEQEVNLSSDNLRLSRVRYEGGEGSALDVVLAQNQLAQARTNYFTAKANYFNARADLEVSSGR